MPKLLEYDIAIQTKLQVVVPDNMSDELLAGLVMTKAYDLLCKKEASITLTGEPKSLTIAEAQAHKAHRVSDSWRRITDEEVRWLGEGT